MGLGMREVITIESVLKMMMHLIGITAFSGSSKRLVSIDED
jgi:hypothetical protein